MASDQATTHKRSKHFGIEWAFFKESVALGEILPVFVPTDQQPADMLTKAIMTNKFAEYGHGWRKSQAHFDGQKMVTHLLAVMPKNQSEDALDPQDLKKNRKGAHVGSQK